MNTTKIFQNSWNLMLRYRALWIFGVILALTTVSFASSFWLHNDEDPSDQTLVNWEISAKDQAWIKENFGLDLPLSYTLEVEDLTFRLDDPSLSTQERTRLLKIAASVTAVLLVLLIVTMVFRYIANTALITMVNDKQGDMGQYNVRQGWSLGFSTGAVKLLLIDLVVYPLLFILTVVLILPAMFPLFIVINGSPSFISAGILLMLSLLLICVVAIIGMWIAAMVHLQLSRRACLIEGLGIFAAIWRGIRLMRNQMRGVGLTWLVLLGVDLVYPILVAPVAILLVAFGLVIGGLLAFALGALLVLVLVKPIAWTIAIIVGLVILMLVVGMPMTLLSGLREVFKSSAWTLTYKEAVSNRNIARAPSPHSELRQAGRATI